MLLIQLKKQTLFLYHMNDISNCLHILQYNLVVFSLQILSHSSDCNNDIKMQEMTNIRISSRTRTVNSTMSVFANIEDGNYLLCKDLQTLKFKTSLDLRKCISFQCDSYCQSFLALSHFRWRVVRDI